MSNRSCEDDLASEILDMLRKRSSLCQNSRLPLLSFRVSLMDYFMDNHDIPEPQLHLVALSCFLIAAKFDEIENRIPTIEQLNSFVQNSFERSEFHAMELLLLDHFSWSVDLPTAASFVDTFLVSSVLSDDIHSGQPLTNCTKAKVYVKKYVHYFLEISLQDHRFLLFKPSVVTAAAVAAARSCLHLTPTWKSALIELTKFEFLKYVNASTSCSRPMMQMKKPCVLHRLCSQTKIKCVIY